MEHSSELFARITVPVGDGALDPIATNMRMFFIWRGRLLISLSIFLMDELGCFQPKSITKPFCLLWRAESTIATFSFKF